MTALVHGFHVANANGNTNLHIRRIMRAYRSLVAGKSIVALILWTLAPLKEKENLAVLVIHESEGLGRPSVDTRIMCLL